MVASLERSASRSIPAAEDYVLNFAAHLALNSSLFPRGMESVCHFAPAKCLARKTNPARFGIELYHYFSSSTLKVQGWHVRWWRCFAWLCGNEIGTGKKLE